MQKKKTLPVEFLAVTAMLTACQIVLGNLLQVPMLGKQYNIGLLPIAVAGKLLGVPGAMIVGGLGDLIGALVFPAGAYFPGFTLTQTLVGLVCGLMLHRRPVTWLRSFAAVFLALAVVTQLLNPIWLSYLGFVPGRGYWTWLTVRAPNYLVEVPINTVLCCLTLKALMRVKLPAALR